MPEVIIESAEDLKKLRGWSVADMGNWNYNPAKFVIILKHPAAGKPIAFILTAATGISSPGANVTKLSPMIKINIKDVEGKDEQDKYRMGA